MELQNFGIVLAVVALLPCIIHGRSELDYLNGILFEAPADVLKTDSDAKLSFEAFHNKFAPIFEILPDHLAISKLKDPNEFKKFLETELLYDAPEDVLYDAKDAVTIIYGVVESITSCFPGASIVSSFLENFGYKDLVIDFISGNLNRETEKDLERKAILEEVKKVLKAMGGMLGPLFNQAVEITAAETKEIVRKKEIRHWRQRVRRLKNKLRRQSELKQGNKKEN